MTSSPPPSFPTLISLCLKQLLRLLCSEGDPMRLLFERDLTPHPQYAAFYKWLHLSLKPDCLIHFGTHPSSNSFSSPLCSFKIRFLFFPRMRVCAITPYHHIRSGQGHAILTLHYTTLHFTTPHYTTLHFTTPHYTTLHFTTPHYTTLHEPLRLLSFLTSTFICAPPSLICHNEK